MSSTVKPPNLRIIQAKTPWVNQDGTPTTYFYRLFESIVNGVNQPSPGVYTPTFQSGYVVYTGPNGTLTASPSFQFGTNLPNPSGIPGNALFLGADSGSGVQVSTWIITDQAQDVNTPGPMLGMTAGEAQPNSTEPGGLLWFLGGAASLGTGGEFIGQGGTSLSGTGGNAILQGGNSTNGIPGDAYVIAGENGTQGANVQLLATTLNGISGVIRHRWNSNFIWDEFHDGSWYFYLGGGFGLAGQYPASQGPGLPVTWTSPPVGLEQTLFYALGYSPHTSGTADVALTSVVSPTNRWIPTHIWCFQTSTTSMTSAFTGSLQLWTSAAKTGFNLNQPNTSGEYAQLSTLAQNQAIDLSNYAWSLAQGTPSMNTVTVPATTTLYVSASTTNADSGVTYDIYVQGYVLPFGP